MSPLKKQITIDAANFLQLTEDHATNILSAMMWKLWKHPMSDTNLRLTKSGKVLLEQMNYQRKTFNITAPITSKVFALLDKRMQGPYYFNNQLTKLDVYDDRDALMLSLLSGDLEKYLKNHSFS